MNVVRRLKLGTRGHQPKRTSALLDEFSAIAPFMSLECEGTLHFAIVFAYVDLNETIVVWTDSADLVERRPFRIILGIKLHHDILRKEHIVFRTGIALWTEALRRSPTSILSANPCILHRFGHGRHDRNRK